MYEDWLVKMGYIERFEYYCKAGVTTVAHEFERICQLLLDSQQALNARPLFQVMIFEKTFGAA